MDTREPTEPTSSAPAAGEAAHVFGRVKRVGLLLAIVALVVLGASLFSAHRAAAQLRASTEGGARIVVATTQPQPMSADDELVLPGNVQADYEAPIYARTSGYLKRWLVDIGTPVKAGQLLAEVDAPEVDQQLHQVQADLATAEANAKLARVTAERFTSLRATDSVSRQEADEKSSLAESLEAQVQSARANLQRLRELATFERITAPFDGIVTARNTDVGQLINAGGGMGPELFRVADRRRLRLYVHVPQIYAARLTSGMTAQLSFPDRPGKRYPATLQRTAGALEPATRTLLVELIIDNNSGELLPGAYVEVHFKMPPGSEAATYKLPANVLLFRGDGMHVATVDSDAKVVLKAISLGRDFGSDIEVVQGIGPQDRVILSPPDSLADGAAVSVATTPAKAGRS